MPRWNSPAQTDSGTSFVACADAHRPLRRGSNTKNNLKRWDTADSSRRGNWVTSPLNLPMMGHLKQLTGSRRLCSRFQNPPHDRFSGRIWCVGKRVSPRSLDRTSQKSNGLSREFLKHRTLAAAPLRVHERQRFCTRRQDGPECAQLGSV